MPSRVFSVLPYASTAILGTGRGTALAGMVRDGAGARAGASKKELSAVPFLALVVDIEVSLLEDALAWTGFVLDEEASDSDLIFLSVRWQCSSQ